MADTVRTAAELLDPTTGILRSAYGISAQAIRDAVVSLFDLSDQCSGRLTLTSGVPLPTSAVTGASTIYFTPWRGDTIVLWSGSLWVPYKFTQLSRSLASLTSARNYDVFAYLSSGAVAIDLAPVWTNDTTRDKAVSLKDGIWVNDASFTAVRSGDSVGQYQGTLLGTIRTTSSSTTELSDSKGFVSNAIHPRLKTLAIACAGGSHTYTTGSFRPWANDSTNRMEWVNSLPGISGHQRVRGSFQHPGTGSTALGLGIAVDSTTTADAVLECATAMTYSGPMDCRISHALVGYHYSQVVERGTGTGSSSFFYANAEADLWL